MAVFAKRSMVHFDAVVLLNMERIWQGFDESCKRIKAERGQISYKYFLPCTVNRKTETEPHKNDQDTRATI